MAVIINELEVVAEPETPPETDETARGAPTDCGAREVTPLHLQDILDFLYDRATRVRAH
jgi:hypothetical protein